MSERNLSFGMLSGIFNVTWTEMLAIWQESEKLGYESGWLSDHFFPYAANHDGLCLECWTTLTALSRETTKMRLGTLVLASSFRNPGLLARMAATLDGICGGRLDLGIGAGWFEAEYRAYGFPCPKPAVRIRQLEEAVQVIRLLWAERSPTFEGKYFRLEEAYCRPKPVQHPGPPLWIGGSGEQLTLRAVAKHADGWNAFQLPLEDFRRKLSVLEEHCRAVGRDPATVRKSVGIVPLVSYDEGKIATTVGRMSEAQRRGLIAGTPEACAEQLRSYVDLGAELIIAIMRTPYDYESLRLFATEVIPLLKAR